MSNLININSDELVKATNKLEKISRASLPVTVRNTLNELAFQMKGFSGTRGQIDKEAEKSFDYRRNRTLFKAFTGVDKARGLNIKNMQSEAGIIERSGRNEVAEGLAQQQKGGKVKSKSTPTNKARIGKSVGKKVRKKNFFKSLGEPYLIRQQRGQVFTRLALRAIRTGRPILVTVKGGQQIIGQVRRFTRNKGGIRFKIDWLYRINRTGFVKLQEKRPFVNNATLEVIKNGDKIFKEKAEKRIKKQWEK